MEPNGSVLRWWFILWEPVTFLRPSLPRFDSCHRKMRILSALVAKARRKEKEPSACGGEEPKLYLEAAVLERKLQDTDLRALVALPPGLDYNEWLASHTIAFFEHVNLVYGTISEFCTMSGCSEMSGPATRTYLWFDEKGKKTRVPAPQYIDYVMTFIQKTVTDETIFPTKYANEFPSSFESIVRKILRLLYHVLAHVYHCHFREVVLLNMHTQLNCVFAHLTVFDHHFHLIDPKETEVLHDLVSALHILNPQEQQDRPPSSSSSDDPPPCPPHSSSDTNNSCSSGSCSHTHHQQSAALCHNLSLSSAQTHAECRDDYDGVINVNKSLDGRSRDRQDEPMVICDEPRFTTHNMQCFQPQAPQPHRDFEHLSL